jgi:hypothetical protein
MFDKNAQNSAITIDHSPWQFFLTRYLAQDEFGQTYFAYAEVNKDEMAQLNEYLANLQKVTPWLLTRQEEKAFWINLYNALTVKVVLDAYPVDSIKDIDSRFGGLLATGPWEKQRIQISGVPLSLNNIEHDIVRPKYQDYRIHFALNCAAKGCPNLSPTAFSAQNTEQLLTEAEQTFVNHQRGARFENGKLILSKIFDWYLKDFANDEAELLTLLAKSANTQLQTRLSGYRGRIKYEYDWTLNEAN